MAPTDGDLATSEVRISPSAVFVGVGDIAQLTASVRLASGSGNRTVTWSSSDTTIARVDQGGHVIGLRGGQTTVSASSNEKPDVIGATLVSVVGTMPAITISEINTRVCTASNDCAWQPANLNAVSGQLDIAVNVSTGGEPIKSVQVALTCAGTSIIVQRTDLDLAPGPPPGQAQVNLSMNTMETDATGTPKLPDGPCYFSVTALSVSGRQAASSITLAILKNRTS